MSARFKRGESVKQVLPAPIAGVVISVLYDEKMDAFNYKVAAGDGGAERWFSEDQIESVDAKPAAIEGKPA